MAHYMEWSTRVYNVYLKYAAPEDIHNYSIDEVLMDVTSYLPASGLTARELAMRIVLDVLETPAVIDEQLCVHPEQLIEQLLVGHGAAGDIAHGVQPVPKHAHGTANLEEYTASTKRIISAALELFDRVIPALSPCFWTPAGRL